MKDMNLDNSLPSSKRKALKRRRFLQIMAGGFAGSIAFGSTGYWRAMNSQERSAIAALFQGTNLRGAFEEPPDEAGLWVYWYWMYANASREGITSDLEAMAEVGIKTAALFSIGERNTNSTVVDRPADPQSEYWWELVTHALAESKRLGITILLNACDGWATAGGPWITPEYSQQHIIWSELELEGDQEFRGILENPHTPEESQTSFEQGGGFGGNQSEQPWDQAVRDYYRDIAVLAFPVPESWGETSESRAARVTTTLPISDLDKVADGGNTEQVVDTDQEGWIQFEFERPFVLRSITVHHGRGYNIPAHSLEVEVSDDGTNFRPAEKLSPMLGGWQSRFSELTHSFPETSARFFRFVYRPGPVLPFDEQLHIGTRSDDNNRLKLSSIVLSSTAVIHHLPGKNAQMWGKSQWMTKQGVPVSACVPLDSIIDLTDLMRPDGSLAWQVPPGTWRILRLGYASTGETNGPAGAGQGLECDKLNAEAARIQFDGWFGEALRRAGPELRDVIQVFHVDSWENGSQNWSPVFRDEFRQRRGYDIAPYLPAITGIPIENGEVTERFLLDFRTTIADLTYENFFVPMSQLVHENGCIFSGEVTNVWPCDHMLHYEALDIPMGEFWVTAQQNYKPLDVKEAVSAARIYGKRIVQTESFTGGGDWSEHPGNLKALGDHNFAQGVNRFMLHVWAEQAVPNRTPGIPGPAGTYFNQNQTWFKHANPWFDYLRRSEALLQMGTSISDALYYTGENIPRRALNEPEFGITFVIDPVLPKGYTYDSVNRDALLRLARVKNGRIIFPSGVSYRILVLPPEDFMTPEVVRNIRELVAAGATVVGRRPLRSPSLKDYPNADTVVQQIAQEVWGNVDGVRITENHFSQGRVIWGKPLAEVFNELGVAPDVEVEQLLETSTGRPYQLTLPERYDRTLIGEDRVGGGVQWTHRQRDEWDLYFLTNQEPVAVSTEVTFRISGRIPELWHPDTGKIEEVALWREESGRTIIPMEFDPAGSVFVVFSRLSLEVDQIVTISETSAMRRRQLQLQQTAEGLETWASSAGRWILRTRTGRTLQVTAANVPDPVSVEGSWNVSFPVKGSVKQVQLQPGSWTNHSDEDVRYFSGTATYTKEITVSQSQLAQDRRLFLDLGEVANLARICLNGNDLGILWKSPYMIEITEAAVAGRNRLEIEVTNTWRNRLTGDAGKPEDERTSWLATGGGFGGRRGQQSERPLLPAGLLGPVQLTTRVKVTPST